MLQVTTHNLIGYFSMNDTKRFDSLKKFTRAMKKSTLFIDVSMIDEAILESETALNLFKEGKGLYLWVNDKNGPQRLVKYAYDYDDPDSLITFIEVESLPPVLYYQSSMFSRVFAGVLKVACYDLGTNDSLCGQVRQR